VHKYLQAKLKIALHPISFFLLKESDILGVNRAITIIKNQKPVKKIRKQYPKQSLSLGCS